MPSFFAKVTNLPINYTCDNICKVLLGYIVRKKCQLYWKSVFLDTKNSHMVPKVPERVRKKW